MGSESYTWPANSILQRGSLGVIDDQNLQRTSGAIEFQAELLLDSGEEGRGHGTVGGHIVGRPVQGEIEDAGECSSVQHGSAEFEDGAGEAGGEFVHRKRLGGN